MNSVYIRATGMHTEYFDCLAELDAVLNHRHQRKTPEQTNIYKPLNTRLNKSEIDAIAREDRSILNDLSTSILNAIGDMLVHADKPKGLEKSEQTPIYAGTDGVAEYGFSSLNKVIERHGGVEETMHHLGELSGLTNPRNMMRYLSTNPLYHASKRMQARGGGYPIRGMSLSGLYALEDAFSDLRADRCRQGVIVAAGSMRNFDSLVVFDKLGLLSKDGDSREIDPSFGSSVILLDNNHADSNSALAEVISISSRYSPNHFPSEQDWIGLFEDVCAQQISPDVIVTYCNGVQANNKIEMEAVEKVFPDIEQRNYKALLGYTSKANNALDLTAALADRSIPVGATILINGAGFGTGIGYMVIKKLKQSTLDS